MSVGLYDDAIVSSLRTLTADTRISILPPDNVFRLVARIRDDEIEMPLISLNRTGLRLTDSDNHSMKFEGALAKYTGTEDEYNDGSIPEAINIDIYKGQGFIYRVEELDKSKNYYVYCAAGVRSANACNTMEQLGFESNFNLLGGFSNWEGPTE